MIFSCFKIWYNYVGRYEENHLLFIQAVPLYDETVCTVSTVLYKKSKLATPICIVMSVLLSASAAKLCPLDTTLAGEETNRKARRSRR